MTPQPPESKPHWGSSSGAALTWWVRQLDRRGAVMCCMGITRPGLGWTTTAKTSSMGYRGILTAAFRFVDHFQDQTGKYSSGTRFQLLTYSVGYDTLFWSVISLELVRIHPSVPMQNSRVVFVYSLTRFTSSQNRSVVYRYIGVPHLLRHWSSSSQ
jgi:hypothetical protein